MAEQISLAELRRYLRWLNEVWLRSLDRDPLMRCAECGIADDGRRGWTLRLDVDDELVAFCPECDRKEFHDA
jgi:hypothetical protein